MEAAGRKRIVLRRSGITIVKARPDAARKLIDCQYGFLLIFGVRVWRFLSDQSFRSTHVVIDRWP